MTSTNTKEGKAQVRTSERINSGLELGINVGFDFIVEKWSKFLCICLRPKQWYLELCLVGRIWSGVLTINISSMKRFQGSCINPYGSLKECLHHLGWRLFMEFKKSASPKVDQNPEVKIEKKLSLALSIVRWIFHSFLLENFSIENCSFNHWLIICSCWLFYIIKCHFCQTNNLKVFFQTRALFRGLSSQMALWKGLTDR